jgi:hypothetical protein
MTTDHAQTHREDQMKRLALTLLVAGSVAACSAAPTPAPPTRLVINVTPAPFVAPTRPVMVGTNRLAIPTPQPTDDVTLQHIEQELTAVNQKLDAICKTLAGLGLVIAQTNTSGVTVILPSGC